MTDLKEKLFSCGIFGTSCALLKHEEILALLHEPWAEFITDEQIRELESSFTTVALDSQQLNILEEFEEKTKSFNSDFENIGSTLHFSERNFHQLSQNIKNMRPSPQPSQIFNNFDFYQQNLLQQITQRYIVRMNTVAWKEYLTNGSFNFTSKEYYFIFDMLIRVNDEICVSEMRTTLNIDPKKMFYIIKKITSLGYVTRTERDSKVFVRICRDKHGMVSKGKKKEKKRSINSEDIVPLPSNTEEKDKKIGSEILLGVPLVMQMKNLIDKSRNGVSSRDIEEKFGIKLKIGLKLLLRIADRKDGSIKTVEEFEGKIKRTKFYNVNELNKRKERKRRRIEAGEIEEIEDGIQHDDRVNAIEKLLQKKPAIMLDKEVFKEFQMILGTKYNFDKRTIVNAAKKAGYNVFKVPQDISGPKFVIARPNIQESDPIIQKLRPVQSKAVNLTQFQKNVHKFFVLSNKFTEVDNLYQVSLSVRLNILINFLSNVNKNNFVLDCDLLGEMPIYTFFQLISFKKPKFLFQMLEMFTNDYKGEDLNNIEDLTKKENILNTQAQNIFTPDHFFDPKDVQSIQNILVPESCFKSDSIPQNENFTQIQHTDFLIGSIIDPNILLALGIPYEKKIVEFLEKPMNFLFTQKLPSDILKLLRIKFETQQFVFYLKELERIGKIYLDMSTDVITFEKRENFHLLINNIQPSPPFVDYMSLNEREIFFEKICNVPEQQFIRECQYIINRDYGLEKKRLLMGRLSAFKKQNPSLIDEKSNKVDFLPTSLQDLYVKIKKCLVSDEKIEFDLFRFEDVEMILQFMRSKKIIASNCTSFDNLELTNSFKKKFNTKFDEIFLTEDISIDKSDNYHEYYSHYFDLVFYTIMRNGSYELSKLSEDLEILECFEIEQFLTYFNTFFKLETIGNKWFVSILENDNIFLRFPEE